MVNGYAKICILARLKIEKKIEAEIDSIITMKV